LHRPIEITPLISSLTVLQKAAARKHPRFVD
jgi:hypothetical protein